MHSEQPNCLALELGWEEQDFKSEFPVVHPERLDPGRAILPIGRELHRSEDHRRMSVEESLEPLAPLGIRRNVGEQGLND